MLQPQSDSAHHSFPGRSPNPSEFGELLHAAPFEQNSSLNSSITLHTKRPATDYLRWPLAKTILELNSGQVPADKCHDTWAVIATFNSTRIFFHEFSDC